MRIGCVGLVILLFAGAALGPYLKYQSKDETTFTVSSAERQCDSNGDNSLNCYYVVLGNNGEVFTNEDSLYNMKFDSASLQGKFIPGQTYKVTTEGWRVPLFSMKPNIITAELVK